MRTLYPEIDPFNTFFLETNDRHQVYVEQCGNPDGIPAIFLHGGPCSGCRVMHRRFFDPQKYHIILFDQRGSGRSLPFGEIRQNNTQNLLLDMERIRKQLKIENWLLFGGSWGAALAILYATAFVRQVSGMVIRGTFLAREQDLRWFLEDGAGRVYPELWQKFGKNLAEITLNEWIDHLWQKLHATDTGVAMRVAMIWQKWGNQVTLGSSYQAENDDIALDEKLLQQVKMEIHFARNRYFVAEGEVLNACQNLQGIPVSILHGRQDLVCPAEAAFMLKQRLPKATLKILPDAGHIAQGESMIDALVTATDDFAVVRHG